MRSSSGGDITSSGAEIRRFFLENGADGVGGSVATKGALAADHLVEYRAETEDVGARINGGSAALLGRHIAERSQQHAAASYGIECRLRGHAGRSRFRHGQLGQAEVENFHVPIARDENIFRFQITMENAVIVCSSESANDLQPIVDRLAHGQRAAAQACSKGFALKQFGDDIWRPVLAADVEHSQNIRMI